MNMGTTNSKIQCENVQSGSKINVTVEGICKDINKSLDLMGYSIEMIQYRRDTNKLLDDIHNKVPFSVTSITTGGKSEGTAIYFESDIDRLYVVKGVTCLEPGLESSSQNILHLDRSKSSPGYTRLKVFNLLEITSLREHLVKEDGTYLVANSYTIFQKNAHMIDINGERITKQQKSGPSAPYGNTSINYDFVLGFECTCPDLITKWVNRRRKFGWPGLKLIKEIEGLEGHVVPVANKGSLFPNSEWRICYTKAELLLMHSLTELQTKLYILLKLLAKSVLKPLCREMSSYIMKNIVFWVVETNPEENFTEQSLIDRLTDCLTFLKDCLCKKQLKSYMIEERNLFEGRITENEREILLKTIDGLVNEKHNMLLRCEKLRHTLERLKSSPEELRERSAKRNEVEKLVYRKNIVFRQYDQPGQTVEEFQRRLTGDKMYAGYENELRTLLATERLDNPDEVENSDIANKIKLAKLLS